MTASSPHFGASVVPPYAHPYLALARAARVSCIVLGMHREQAGSSSTAFVTVISNRSPIHS